MMEEWKTQKEDAETCSTILFLNHVEEKLPEIFKIQYDRKLFHANRIHSKLTAGKMISQKWELKTENNENLIIAIL